MEIRLVEDVEKLFREIIGAFNPNTDRDCPNIHHAINFEREINCYERVKEVNLRELRPGRGIYFIGQQSPAHYTLKIMENGLVSAWRDEDSNALIGPLNMIVTRHDPITEKGIEEGIIRVRNTFVMPYFNYNTDTDSAKIKEVLKPSDLYFGTCMGILLTKE